MHEDVRRLPQFQFSFEKTTRGIFSNLTPARGLFLTPAGGLVKYCHQFWLLRLIISFMLMVLYRMGAMNNLIQCRGLDVRSSWNIDQIHTQILLICCHLSPVTFIIIVVGPIRFHFQFCNFLESAIFGAGLAFDLINFVSLLSLLLGITMVA